jgi:hypothetical protein
MMTSRSYRVPVSLFLALALRTAYAGAWPTPDSVPASNSQMESNSPARARCEINEGQTDPQVRFCTGAKE